ncbi:MAG: histidine phosphatase family protein [Candidatus Woesearchaeota archaeon]
MRLVLVRHGETVQNSQGICQGQSEGQLSAQGMEQAKRLGSYLKDRQIDAIYSSDLARAVDTAEAIRRFHDGLGLKLDSRLRERYFGDLEGKVNPITDWNNLPGYVETDQQLYDRAVSFLEDILERHEDDTIVAVSHGGMKRAFYTLLHDLPVSSYNAWEHIKNTSVSEFDIQKDNVYKVHSLNRVDHLY